MFRAFICEIMKLSIISVSQLLLIRPLDKKIKIKDFKISSRACSSFLKSALTAPKDPHVLQLTS